ncbi:uncharacterized protein LOC112559321 [Pomacea canaliculata]|nr:uncharacterized protein LOC112559321 [Pomacea canaliculata]
MLPSYQDLDKVFRKAKLIAYIGGVISILLFICVIPGAMALLHVMSEAQFRGWVMALQIWCLLATVIVIVVVPLEEVTLIVAHMRRNTFTESRGRSPLAGRPGQRGRSTWRGVRAASFQDGFQCAELRTKRRRRELPSLETRARASVVCEAAVESKRDVTWISGQRPRTGVQGPSGLLGFSPSLRQNRASFRKDS